jgi:hypothetical protein
MPIPYAEPGSTFGQQGTESYGGPPPSQPTYPGDGRPSAWRQPPPPPRPPPRKTLYAPILMRSAFRGGVPQSNFRPQWNGALEEAGGLSPLDPEMPSCTKTLLAPWLAPCCPDCAASRAAAGAVGASGASSPASGIDPAVLVLGGFFVLVLFGGKLLRA